MSEGKKIREILEKTKTIAVVGLSPKTHRTSHYVSGYLQENGYKIIPVYPREEKILGEKVYRHVADIKEKVEMVLIFRRSEEVLAVVKDALKIKPLYIWMQEGIINKEAEKLAVSKGVAVVMDRCMFKEHKKI
ncbi:MAG TPA: CoA-binding protein [bacterium]|nr:CoA-binding protein [bacterium]